MPEENNNKQNIAIARLEERINSLEERFEKFCGNEFKHLTDKVDKLGEKIDNNKMWLIGVLVSVIMLLLATIFK